jgi:fructoselysine 3-epimerase
MKFSSATSVFVNYPFKEAVNQVIKAGFEGIDIWCGRPHLYRRDYPESQILEIRKMLAENGVKPVSLMPAFFRYPYSLSSPVDSIRQDSIAYVKECIDNSCLIGARQVLIVPTPALYSQTIDDSRDRFYDSLNQLCPVAEKSGILLGIEVLYPKLSEYMCSSRDAKRAIDTLGFSCLKVVLDTGHAHLSGEKFGEALHNLGDLVIQVHVNDNDGKQQQNGIPGSGSFDFSSLAKILSDNGYNEYLTVELGWNYSFDPYPAVCDALNKIKYFIADN